MKTLTIFGDSILFGIITNEHGKYLKDKDFDPRKIAENYGIDLLNLSQMGRNSREGVKIVEDYISTHGAPQYAIIEFGGNDANHNWIKIGQDPSVGEPKIPREEFEENLKTMANLLRKNGTKIAFMNLPPLISEPFFDFVAKTDEAKKNVLTFLGDKDKIYRVHEEYNRIVEKVAKDLDAPLIDARSPFLEALNIHNLVCMDGCHPSPLGHELIAKELEKYFKTI